MQSALDDEWEKEEEEEEEQQISKSPYARIIIIKIDRVRYDNNIKIRVLSIICAV